MYLYRKSSDMPPILRNIIAVITALIIGSIVNMMLVKLAPAVIPYPSGTDFSTPEGLKTSMHLMEPKHFIFPFLAHAFGTLSGAFLAAKIGATHKARLALSVGIFFLIGGLIAVMMFPAPMWFNIADLALAYLPMSWLGGRLAKA